MKKNTLYLTVFLIIAVVAVIFYSGKPMSISGLQYYYPTQEVTADGSSLRLYWDVLPPAVLWGQPSTAECTQTLWRYVGAVKIESTSPITPTLTGSLSSANTLQPCPSQYPNTYYYIVGCQESWKPSIGYVVDNSRASPRYYKEFGTFTNPSEYKSIKVVYSALETPGGFDGVATVTAMMCEDVSKETQYAAYPVQHYDFVWGSNSTPLGCGNFVCDATETYESCPTDCDASNICGNEICEDGETRMNCIVDCPNTPTCGDGICDYGETQTTCPNDCINPPLCNNDNICNGQETEVNCPNDCEPSIEPFCGDGLCNNGETQTTCSTDCGTPPVQTAPNIIEQIIIVIQTWLCNNLNIACKV